MIKFTFITITYNASAVVQRTLDSVLGQTYPHIEHIIVDGQSKDDTVAKALAYQRQTQEGATGHEVRIISEPDNGIYDAMNKGLAMVTGTYVCFLNAGDSLYDSRQTALLASFSEAEAGKDGGGRLPAVLYGETVLVDNAGHILRLRRLKAPRRLTWLSFQRGMLVCHQAFYARADIAKLEPYDLRFRFSADVDWCVRVMKQADRHGLPLANTNRILACYLAEGATTANRRASLGERFCVMRRHYGLCRTLIMHAWFVVRAVFKR